MFKFQKKNNKDQLKETLGFKQLNESTARGLQSITSGVTENMKLVGKLNSVGSRLFIIIFCSILICVCSVGIASYIFSKNIISNKVSDSSLVAVQQISKNLSLILSNLETRSTSLLMDNHYQDIIDNYERAAGIDQRYVASNTLSGRLRTMLLTDSSLANIYLIPVNADSSDYTVGTATLDAKDVKDTDWFKEALKQDGKVVWTPTHLSGFSGKGAEPTFGLSRAIRNTATGNVVFVLLFEIKSQSLLNQFADVDLGEGSEIELVDNTNTIQLDSVDSAMIGKSALNGLVDHTTNSGSFEQKNDDGEQLMIVHSALTTGEYRLAGIIPVNELLKDTHKIRNMTWIMAAFAALLAFIIGLLVIAFIAKPLNRLSQLMSQGKEGDLSVRADVRSNDEIGQLSSSFNAMMEQITVLVDQTRLSASEVLLTAQELTDVSKKTAVSAKEIAVATEEIAAGSSTLAVEAERGSDLTSGIDELMKQVKGSNEEMGAAAKEVQSASEQGTAYMNVLTEKTGLTEQMIRNMVDKVDKLKESTGSIRKILEVLGNIAKQTNILSLNATIEAARAGAAGKGFMVVADEVRDLAEQSRQSIQLVAEITEKIQSEINDTVTVLSEAYPLFQEQIGSVKEANEIFLTVQTQMTGFVDRLGNVTDSISILDESQASLRIAMGNVSAVAEESSATSEEVASLSSEQLAVSEGLVTLSDKLEQLSKGLQSALTRFKI